MYNFSELSKISWETADIILKLVAFSEILLLLFFYAARIKESQETENECRKCENLPHTAVSITVETRENRILETH